MEATLPLEQMNTREKLQAIEILWTDLCRNVEDIPVPQWHRDYLLETKKRSVKGQESPLDWENAKNLLRQRFE
ncbi:MAG: addiction module protein [Verrucomicrobiales bacterium]|nr:addiction module protein [Verrucomicrobiales bacterium]